MDPIKPEKDEVDLYQSQKKGQTASESNKLPEPVVKKATVSLTRSGQFALILMFIMVVGLATLGYWQVNQQQKTIQILEDQLTEANTYISRSKLIAARLEGQINQTDATMAQSGNELARELKVLDSEVRKLWDVTNKRNKAWIQDNQKKLEKLTVSMEAANATAEELLAAMADVEKGVERVAGLEESVGQLAAGIDEQASLLSAQQNQQESIASTHQQISKNIEALQAAGENLAATQDALSDQLVKSITGMERKLAAKLASGSGPDANTLKRLGSLESSMKGLDKVRGQLVQRIVQLDSRVNEMQQEIEALESNVPVSARN